MASGASDTPSPAGRRDRVLTPGPGRRGLAAAATVAVILAAGVLIITGLGAARKPAAAGQTYGEIPSWLPKPAAPSDAMVSASAAHPVLAAVEGDTVDAHLYAGSAYVTGVGPAAATSAPAGGRAGTGGSALSPTTFLFTIASARGAVPLRAGAFSILTAAGQILHPTVTLRGGGRLPARATPGKPVNLTLSASLPEGQGALRWAPDGNRVLVAWLYQFELN